MEKKGEDTEEVLELMGTEELWMSKKRSSLSKTGSFQVTAKTEAVLSCASEEVRLTYAVIMQEQGEMDTK